MKVIRVFPRQTVATPTDENVRINCEPGFFDECDQIHISVAFTEDIPRAEALARAWRHVAPTECGGPAYGDPGGEFMPGMYLKHGFTISSRGCPNCCWFCDAWKKEGRTIREYPIKDGWNLADNNILACSPEHQKAVLNMLCRQKRPIEFTGGLEAARLTPWFVGQLTRLRLKQAFFAYDTPDDKEPLYEAGKLLKRSGIAMSKFRAYVLMGYKKDTFEKAEKRLKETWEAGFLPYAMLYQNDDPKWHDFQRNYCRPAITRGLVESL